MSIRDQMPAEAREYMTSSCDDILGKIEKITVQDVSNVENVLFNLVSKYLNDACVREDINSLCAISKTIPAQRTDSNVENVLRAFFLECMGRGSSLEDIRDLFSYSWELHVYDQCRDQGRILEFPI